MSRATRKEILTSVAAVWERPVAAILGESKLAVNLEPRQVAGYLMVEYGGCSTVKAGEVMRRDRSTISHNRAAVIRRLNSGDGALKAKIDRVLAELALPVVDRARPPLCEVEPTPPEPKKPAVVMAPVDQDVAEVKRLRRLGWSLNGICRRTCLPPEQVARMIGAHLVEAGE